MPLTVTLVKLLFGDNLELDPNVIADGNVGTRLLSQLAAVPQLLSVPPPSQIFAARTEIGRHRKNAAAAMRIASRALLPRFCISVQPGLIYLVCSERTSN